MRPQTLWHRKAQQKSKRTGQQPLKKPRPSSRPATQQVAATTSTLQRIGPLPPAIKIRADGYLQAANRPQPLKPPPLYQVWDRPVRSVPPPDLQYDRRASTTGMSTAQHPQASVLAGGDYGGKEAFRQPGGPMAHSGLRAGNQSVHLSDRQEEEEEVWLSITVITMKLNTASQSDKLDRHTNEPDIIISQLASAL